MMMKLRVGQILRVEIFVQRRSFDIKFWFFQNLDIMKREGGQDIEVGRSSWCY